MPSPLLAEPPRSAPSRGFCRACPWASDGDAARGVRRDRGAPEMSTRSFSRVFSPSLQHPGPRQALLPPKLRTRFLSRRSRRPLSRGCRLAAPTPGASCGHKLLIPALSPIINISVPGLARGCPDLPLLRYRHEIKPSQAAHGTKHSIFTEPSYLPKLGSNPAFLSPGCEPSFLLIVRNCCCLIKWRE